MPTQCPLLATYYLARPLFHFSSLSVSLHSSIRPLAYPSCLFCSSTAASRAMEPLVCVVPQSLRVLIDRLPAYISFLEQQGYSVYRQSSTRLTASQAHMLFARTQDELFTLHTPVAVLLLERKQPYAAWQAVREQLDIVYGSPDRKTAMDDIYQFFAQPDDVPATQQPKQQVQQPQQSKAAVASKLAALDSSVSMHAPPPPPPPPSGPPPPESDDEDDAMDGAFLVQPANQPSLDQGAPPPPPPPQPPSTTQPIAFQPPPPPPPSQFQWEEMESDAAVDTQPASASPRPFSPSDSPVAFHGPPDSPQALQQLPGEEEMRQESEQAVMEQKQLPTSISETASLAAPPAPTSESPTEASVQLAIQPPPTNPASSGIVVSPLARMSETKRGSFDAPVTGAVLSSKGPLDLLALPARMSIKERLAALNLAQEAAQANNDPAANGSANNGNIKPAGGAPVSGSPSDERRASLSMQQKQATLTILLAKAARLSLEKTPINGTRAIVPPTAVCPFASMAALAPNGPLPQRSSQLPAVFEYTTNLPSAALLLSAVRTQRGVLHHMTGDEDEWGQRFAVLHLDSLYLWPSADQHDEPQLMICVSEPTISLAYAEGVIEVKGPAGGRHLMAAELPDIQRWYEELTRAKIEMASEDKRKTDEADGSSRRSSLTSPSAASLAIGVGGHTDGAECDTGNGGTPLSLQQQMRQMRQASNAAGVSAVRHTKDEGRAAHKSGEDGSSGAGSVDYSDAASLHRTLQPPPDSLPHSSGTSGGNYGGTQLDDTAYLRSLLLHGALFTKYKYKRGKQRWIWCSPSLDTLYWSEEKGRKVKGQLNTNTVTGVADGCVGVKRKGVGLTVVAEDRTLDLEARDEEQQKDWLRAIGLLINLNRQ